MVNPFIEHLVIVTYFMKSGVVRVINRMGWLFRGEVQPRYFWVGYGQFVRAIFVFKQEVFNLRVRREETGLFHTCYFERLSRLSASNICGSQVKTTMVMVKLLLILKCIFHKRDVLLTRLRQVSRTTVVSFERLAISRACLSLRYLLLVVVFLILNNFTCPQTLFELTLREMIAAVLFHFI